MYWHDPDVTLPELTPPDGMSREVFESALDTARTFCGWHIAPVATHPLTLDGPGNPVLILPSLAVQSATGVVNDGSPVDAGSYNLSTASQALHHVSCWTNKPSGVSLTITHGFTQMPLAVLKAIVSIAQSEATGGTGYVAAGSFTYSGQPVSKDSTTGLTAYEEGALRNFKLGPRP